MHSYFLLLLVQFRWLILLLLRPITLLLPKWTLLKSFWRTLTPELQLKSKVQGSWRSSINIKNKFRFRSKHLSMWLPLLKLSQKVQTPTTSNKLLFRLLSLRTLCFSRRTTRFRSIRLLNSKLKSQESSSSMPTRCLSTFWLLTATTFQSWWAALLSLKFRPRFFQFSQCPLRSSSLSLNSLNRSSQSLILTWASKTWSSSYWPSLPSQILKLEWLYINSIVSMNKIRSLKFLFFK